MRVYQFTEQPYYPGWDKHAGSLRVNFLNRNCDPHIASDLFHRYYDEWQLADELGLDIMLNEHHQTATCMSSTVVVGLSVLARITRQARLLVLGYPIGHRPDPLRCAEELSTIDVISRGRLDMGFIKGVPYEFPSSNQNPVAVMDRFWERATAKGKDANPYRASFLQLVGVAETDAAAGEIVDRQAAEVVAFVRAAGKRLELEDEEIEVVLGGSLLQSGNRRLLRGIDAGLLEAGPRFSAVVARSRPIVGAVLTGLDRLAVGPEAYERAREELDRATTSVGDVAGDAAPVPELP